MSEITINIAIQTGIEEQRNSSSYFARLYWWSKSHQMVKFQDTRMITDA